MCRLVGWVARRPMTVVEALGEEGVAGVHRLAALHADGWGTATYESGDVVITKSTRRADLDEAFVSATTDRASEIGLLHLRWATPGLPVEPANTHPFQRGDHAFAHNGAIYPSDRLDAMLHPAMLAQLAGTTDSERYFLAVEAELERGIELPQALAEVTRRVSRDFAPSSLNAVLTTPESLYAVSCHDPTAAPNYGASVSGDLAHATGHGEDPYFDLYYRVLPDAVVVVSSGIVTVTAPGWQLLPNDSVLVVDRGTLATRTVALGSGLPEAASLKGQVPAP